MSLGTAAPLSAGFTLLLLLPLLHGALAGRGGEALPVRVTVVNDLSNMTPESYLGSVVEGGVLLGALRRLQETEPHFKFTVREDPDFGLMLESVNGVAGSEHEQTYWEILSESWGELSRLDVGVGCYKPKVDEHIILRFRTWPQPMKQ